MPKEDWEDDGRVKDERERKEEEERKRERKRDSIFVSKEKKKQKREREREREVPREKNRKKEKKQKRFSTNKKNQNSHQSIRFFCPKNNPKMITKSLHGSFSRLFFLSERNRGVVFSMVDESMCVVKSVL